MLPVRLPIKLIYLHRCREKSTVARWAQEDYELTQAKRQSLGLVFSSWNKLDSHQAVTSLDLLWLGCILEIISEACTSHSA